MSSGDDSFKTNREKAIKIIRSISPRRVVVNCPLFIQADDFIAELNGDGFNAASARNMTSEQISRLWKRKSTANLLIEGHFSDELFQHKGEKNIFTGAYSYVYFYINNTQAYARLVVDVVRGGETRDISKDRLQKLSGPDSSAEIKKFITELINNNHEMYARHCELFDDRILTVLI